MRPMKVLALSVMIALAAATADDKPKRPKLSVKANPAMAISPARVVASADISGGPDDFEEFYCAAVEWDWGDDTRSNNSADCDPYEAGKSEIKRRYAQEHTFRANNATSSSSTGFSGAAGDLSQNQPPIQFRVRFSLKQKNKTVGSGQATIEVRPGLGDGL